MPPLSLKRAGALNGSRVRATADGVVAADPTGSIEAFRALATASAFSTNVSADKIDAFDAHGTILDARAIRTHHAGGDKAAGSMAFEAQQGSWLVRRQAFEALWRDGSRFVYGAVNAGGMGAELPRFGHFCLVVSEPAAQAREIGVFPANSAERYCSPAGDVDRDLARREATSWRDRGHLVTIERATNVPATLRHAWPWLICNPTRYVEAVVTPGPPLAAVDAVRVGEAYLERLADLTLAGSEAALDSATEQRELNAIETVRRWRADHDIAIEAVG
ncbi:MAG: hypothetical protein QOG94_1599 [Solirubrobacteraceae bacterium]|nr:hypothetical protein [Solirubrobacteraceae bacterium]